MTCDAFLRQGRRFLLVYLSFADDKGVVYLVYMSGGGERWLFAGDTAWVLQDFQSSALLAFA